MLASLEVIVALIGAWLLLGRSLNLSNLLLGLFDLSKADSIFGMLPGLGLFGSSYIGKTSNSVVHIGSIGPSARTH